MPWPSTRAWLSLLAALSAAGGAAIHGINQAQARHDLQARASAITGGDPGHGRALVSAVGCGGCHAISGLPQATGKVGPPLTGVGSRAIIAGRLANRPANLIRWIENPRAVDPRTAMPPLGVKPAQARDIAAFLYTR